MLSNKTFRPLIVAVVAAFMLIATVEAAPASDSIACQVCDEIPECYPNACRGGYYCKPNSCTCQLQCIKGNDPRK
ncbi:hypothetical protein BGZ52_000473 [Haplosporangium bisporale]|nr:hypothetical protein BGZ52_000473 [Haplosporangium bisporale]KAF9215709.1 hypothetical protein BGZ59_000529 [Podila verticillata]KFH65924.1 hypothetical protein MVEG_08026 [Podila verticillata NRRL 6337]